MPFQIVQESSLTHNCDHFNAVVHFTDSVSNNTPDSDVVKNDGIGLSYLTYEYGLNLRFIDSYVPRYTGKTQALDGLRAGCRQALELAKHNQIESVAIPLIDAVSLGFPPEHARSVIVEEIRNCLSDGSEMLISLWIRDRSEFRLEYSRLEKVDDYIRRSNLMCWNPPKATASFYDIEPPAPAAKEPEEQKAPKRPRIVFPKPFKHKESIVCAKESSARPQAHQYTSSIQSAAPLRDELPLLSSFDPGREAVLDESFSQMVLRKIDERGYKKDSECYSKANIDRKLFSKIRCDSSYHPKKTTALALAVALELSLKETKELLEKGGYSLSHSFLLDIIVEYCILQGNYDIYSINELLFQYDQPMLG